MKRAKKVSNVHGEVRFKQKQRLNIAFTGNILPQNYIYKVHTIIPTHEL